MSNPDCISELETENRELSNLVESQRKRIRELEGEAVLYRQEIERQRRLNAAAFTTEFDSLER